jgi:hypothetical protein
MPLPNLLSLHSHDTGPRIPPYGYAASAPALSALAGRGMLVRPDVRCRVFLLGLARVATSTSNVVGRGYLNKRAVLGALRTLWIPAGASVRPKGLHECRTQNG